MTAAEIIGAVSWTQAGQLFQSWHSGTDRLNDRVLEAESISAIITISISAIIINEGGRSHHRVWYVVWTNAVSAEPKLGAVNYNVLASQMVRNFLKFFRAAGLAACIALLAAHSAGG